MTPINRLLPKGLSKLRQLQTKANTSTINLSLGKPALHWPPEALPLAVAALNNDRMDYTENAGDQGIREKLAKTIGANDASEIILTHGAQEALMACLLAGLNRGDEVLIPDPGFLAYGPMVRMLGGKPITYGFRKLGESFDHCAQKILAKVTKHTRFIILNSPGNPTGIGLSEESLRGLLDGMGKRRILILSDEVYGALQFFKPYSPLFLHDKRIVTLNAFSKSHALTGWRIGYIASFNTNFMKAALVAHQYTATCASVPAQRLLGRLIDSPLFHDLPKRYSSEYHRNCKWFVDQMPTSFQEGLGFPAGGFYLFPRAPKGNGDDFSDTLLKKDNILVTPGSSFGKAGKGHVRISLAVAQEKLAAAAKKISSYYR
jgi:aspartate aminotransferase